MTPVRSGLAAAAIFFLIASALSGVLPLWLDEILQLRETRNTSTAEMLATVPRNSGAVPLGYLVQQAVLKITGYSARWARLPAMLFGSAAVFLVALLAAELGFTRPWLSAAVFAAFPVTLRYATEARVYSQALFFSVLATLIYASQDDLDQRCGPLTGSSCWRRSLRSRTPSSSALRT
ncbi:MAG: hypothetical protein EXQ47_10130 [Bryobacterales bacterium]|nr:hypothetical protein [Bryobacterales bacterium]